MTDEELVKRLRDPDEMTCADGMEAADRIEALTAKVKLMDDLDVINGEKIEALTAKNEMLGREVNIARYGQPNFAWSVHVQVMDDLNAKLAKAVEALREIAGECGCSTARAIIAEIEGSDAP
jgi:cobalamin biosynthesis Co2+ chelatase CbiK